MYEQFFGLSERPFAATPSAKHYVPSPTIDKARQDLLRCMERAEGIGLIIGPAGTGKTLLCQVLASSMEGRFATAVLSSGRIGNPKALLQAILLELGLPYRQRETGELRLSLIDHVSSADASGDGLALLVDEAHTLPFRVFEELRLISNLVREGSPRVRIVLAGTSTIEERMTNPKLDSFTQRLTARCYLDSLSKEQTAEYVRMQLAGVGAEPGSVFDEAALENVYVASTGVPRIINQVCDHAMMLGLAAETRLLGPAAIDEAWADLQQLPVPWHAPAAEVSSAGSGGSTVDFGGLDDEDEMPESIRIHSPATETFEGATLEGAVAGSEADSPAGDVVDTELIDTGLIDTGAAAEARFDAIEEHLDDLEDEFRPAGSIRPSGEVRYEGVFDQGLDDHDDDHGGAAGVAESQEADHEASSDPFHEEFEEEEVVLDRYALLDTDVFGQRPAVDSPEGRELSALLAPYVDEGLERLTLAVTPQADSESAPASTPEALGQAMSPRAELHPLKSSDLEAPQCLDAESPGGMVEGSENQGCENQGCENQGRDALSDAAWNDDDLIVIVEDRPQERVVEASAAPLVRRLEYGQLFADLRRGRAMEA